MGNGTQATPQAMATPGAAQSAQLDETTRRLLEHMMKPRMQGPQAPPQAQQSLQTPGPQHVVKGLFSLIQESAAAHKKTQLDHATFRIKSISDAIEDAYEHAQGDPEKAKELFMASSAVTSLKSKEGQKDMKQMEKLLQLDYLNPEKGKTVWHEALGKVMQISGAEKVMKGLRHLMGQHKDKVQQDLQKSDKLFAGQQEAGKLADTMFKGARTDPSQRAEVDKMLPSLVTSASADIRQREREAFTDYERQQKQNFTASIDNVKDPVAKANMKAFAAMQDGNTEEANKFLDQAHQMATAKSTRGAQLTVPALVNQSVNDPDPEKRKQATAALDKIWGEQEKQLAMRGASFGMSRPAQYVNSETGETDILNGFQVQNRIKAGEHWQMVGNIPPDTVLAMQQVARTYIPSIEAVDSHLKAFDNAEDRAIISRLKTANPNIRGMDESSLGTWIDQNLMGKLSSDGQLLMQDIKVLAEVLGRLRKLTGQSSSEMNTALLLGIMPDERTPNMTYGKQQLAKVRNYIDGMVQAPILGGGRFAGKSSPKKADEKKKDSLGILD